MKDLRIRPKLRDINVNGNNVGDAELEELGNGPKQKDLDEVGHELKLGL